MGKRLTDEQVAARCRDAIEAGQHLTNFWFQLRNEGWSIYERRLKRIWLEQGGTIRPKNMLYAPGCGPTDDWWRRHG